MVLKHFYVGFYVSTVRWLYKIILDLDDSLLERSAASPDLRPLKPEDGGIDILHSWF